MFYQGLSYSRVRLIVLIQISIYTSAYLYPGNQDASVVLEFVRPGG